MNVFVLDFYCIKDGAELIFYLYLCYLIEFLYA